MSGVWIFDKKGVVHLVENPTRESFEQGRNSESCSGTPTAPGARPRVLVYLPADQVIGSYTELEDRLMGLGWTRYDNPRCGSGMIQFHRSDDSLDLISLPEKFSSLKPCHMYDIVVKNRSFFEVRLVT